jgi:hypothetical protein
MPRSAKQEVALTIQTQFSIDPNAVVTVKVNIIEAPTPNTYQQTGAFVSFGATTLTTGDAELLTQLSDLTLLLPPAMAVTSVAWASSVTTVTLTAPAKGVTVGDVVPLTLSGFTPAGYNGTFQCTFTSTTVFTIPMTSNPGAVTVEGTVQFATVTELSQMATTYFAQGNMSGPYVLELGYQTSFANKVTALNNWLTANEFTIYGFLLPREWGVSKANIDAAETLLKQHQNPEAMTYFWMTVTPTTMSELGPTYKNVIQLIEAPSVTDPTMPNIGAMDGEFTLAAMFYNAITFRPSNTNRVAPMCFKYLYGVTMYPQQNNGPLLKSFKAANTNYVTNGAEGGIAFNMIYQGVTLDGHDYFNWWWCIDWVQINVNLDLSNAIINGSNNPLSPLYYNQDGITQLETTLVGTMQDALAFGMILGRIVMTQLDGPVLQQNISQGNYAGACNVNAVPFLNYTLANPGDYKIGEYDGLSTLFIPARGFVHILVNVVATDLVSV